MRNAHVWHGIFKIIGLLAGSAMLGPFGIAVAVIILVCMAMSEGNSSTAIAETDAQAINSGYKPVPILNVTCPNCGNENVFRESGEVLCTFCGCGLVIDRSLLTVRGQVSKIICVKCSDVLKYNHLDTRCYCYKCDIMYIKKDRSLVANCYACGGSGETGVFKKTICNICNGDKKLGVLI